MEILAQLNSCPVLPIVAAIFISGLIIHQLLVNNRSCGLCTWPKNVKSKARFLFTIAHPDDECMFFGPAIVALTRMESQGSLGRKSIYLLCLSNGDADGLGHIRKTELIDSCRILGLEESQVILHSDLFKDDPKTKWDSHQVAKIINTYLEKLKITHLITFDDYGISGHLNHRSLYDGALILKEKFKSRTKFQILVLTSVNIFRKYSSFMDSVSEIWTNNRSLCVSSWADRKTIRKAMMAHKSQLVWFRRLYIIFSRYLFINTFKCLTALEAD